MSYLVGITGGIGSGKTTVSNIFSHLGFKVYNSDERAKYLMQTNDKIIKSQKLKNKVDFNPDYVLENNGEDLILPKVIEIIEKLKSKV